MPDVPADAATLTAWIDSDGEHDVFHVVVEDDNRVYEHRQTDLEMAVQNQQFVSQVEYPALTLLTAHDRDGEAAGGRGASAETTGLPDESAGDAEVADPVVED
jgi:hypothetical protein